MPIRSIPDLRFSHYCGSLCISKLTTIDPVVDALQEIGYDLIGLATHSNALFNDIIHVELIGWEENGHDKIYNLALSCFRTNHNTFINYEYIDYDVLITNNVDVE